MKFKNVLWVALILVGFIFVACGGSENVEQAQMPDPPVQASNTNERPVDMTDPPIQVPDTLEEQFGMLSLDDSETLASVAWSRDFPDNFPNESFSFTTPDRFSITYSLRIAVADPNHSLDLVLALPTERTDNIRLIQTNEGLSVDVTLSVIHDDANSIFQALYSMGVVERYFVNIRDVFVLGDEQEPPQWQTNSSIVVTFVEL